MSDFPYLLVGSVWALCVVAAVFVCRHDRREERRSAALSDAKNRKVKGTREERPEGAQAPPAPRFEPDPLCRRILALDGRGYVSTHDREAWLPTDDVLVSRAMMGEGGPRR